MKRRLIPHIDDVAGSLSSIEAMIELADRGVITSGSLMVPPGWYPEYVRASAGRDIDMGLHLTLTSESGQFRWRSLTGHKSLHDSAGQMWGTVPELRANADPEAVDAELRSQIDAAASAGIKPTHLDHHMGAALCPEFIARTAGMAIEYGLPMLMPSDLNAYFGVLNTGAVDFKDLEKAAAGLEESGLALRAHFIMGLTHKKTSEPVAAMRRLIASIGDGVHYLSLHCASAADIERIHPNDAHWRLAEFEMFCDPAFQTWLSDQKIEITDTNGYPIRDGV